MLDANGNPIVTSFSPGQGATVVTNSPAVFNPNGTAPISPNGCVTILPFANRTTVTPYVAPPTFGVNGQSLVAGGANFFTDRISNRGARGAGDVNVIFSPLVGIAGNAPYFNFQQYKASVDSVLVDSMSPWLPGNNQKVQGANLSSNAIKRTVAQIQATTTDAAQYQVNLTTGFIDGNLNFQQSSQLTNICGSCQNNSNLPIFTQTYTFPWTLGDNSVVMYPLLGGLGGPVVPNVVTLSLIFSGIEVPSITPTC